VLALPNGDLSFYAKVNRFANDFLWAEKGTKSPPVVDFQGRKVGLLICRDVRDKAPEWEEFYEPGDADIVAFSSNWGGGGFPATSWVTFAESNRTWLVVANRYGKEANNDFGEGGVCVVSPKGKIFCEGIKWGKPCIVYADCRED
jgi:predicted amidohydrolase